MSILVNLLTRLGYRWYPEYSVYEDFGEFNQEQYLAIAHIWSQEDRSIRELHTFPGVGVTVDMAVHDACLHCSDPSSRRLSITWMILSFDISRILLLRVRLDTTLLCVPLTHDVDIEPQVLIQCVEILDRTARALAVELYDTRTRLYDALTQLLPAVSAGIHPEYILLPAQD